MPSTNPHTGSPPTSVTLKQGPNAGKVNAFLNGNTNLHNPDHEFTNTTGTDIIQVQSGVSGFLFVDQVPAALKPGESDPFAEDGGIQVQGGSDNILRIEAAADDTDIVVDPNSSTTSGAVIVNGVRSRFATGVNRVVIRTHDAGFASVEVTSLADNLFLEVDTGQGTDVTMTFGFDDTLHEQVTVKTGAGDDIINIEPNNGDDGADVLVDFVYATQLGLGNELNVYSAGSATLANAPGTSGGTRYVDQVNVRGSGTTTRGGVTVEQQAVIGDLQVQVYGTATIDASGSVNISTFQVDGEGQASIESSCTIGIMNVDGTAEFTADCSIDHFADSAGRINVLAGANVTVLNQSEIFNYDLIPAELRVVGTGAKVLFKTTRTHIQMLTVDDGGVVELQQRNQAPTSSDARVLIVDELDLVGSGSTPSGRLDLMDNNLILNNQPSPSNALADITAYIKHSLENGGNYDWLGNGIGSTWAYSQNQSAGSFLYALGVILNDLAQVGGSGPVYNSFAGVSVGQDDVLVKYTYFGDADLSGNVDATDYSLIDNGYTNQLGGWINGDFDYSGTIDATDYALIDNAFTNQGGPLFAGGGDDDVLTTAAQDLFGKFADEYDLLSPQQMIDLHSKHLGSEYDDALSAVRSGKLH